MSPPRAGVELLSQSSILARASLALQVVGQRKVSPCKWKGTGNEVNKACNGQTPDHFFFLLLLVSRQLTVDS